MRSHLVPIVFQVAAMVFEIAEEDAIFQIYGIVLDIAFENLVQNLRPNRRVVPLVDLFASGPQSDHQAESPHEKRNPSSASQHKAGLCPPATDKRLKMP